MEMQCELIASSLFRAHPTSAGPCIGSLDPARAPIRDGGELRRARCEYPAGADSLAYKEECRPSVVVLQ